MREFLQAAFTPGTDEFGGMLLILPAVFYFIMWALRWTPADRRKERV